MDLPDDMNVEELRALVGRLCDCGLSPTEYGRLDAALRASATARHEYISLMEIHARLNAQAFTLSAPQQFAAAKAEQPIHRPAGRSLFFRPPLAFAAASLAIAALFAALYIASSLRTPAGRDDLLAVDSSTGKAAEHVADIVDESKGSSYYIERSGRGDRAKIYQGETLRIKAGRLRVDVRSGVKLTLQGPAAITFVSDLRTRALLGGLKATVGSGAHGFTVSTPVAEVIDHGTVFGVKVDSSGGTDVAVFAGVVDVRTTVHVDSEVVSLRLARGDAVRLDDRGAATRFDLLKENDFPNFLRTHMASRVPIITDAYDNQDPLGRTKEYEVVASGMDEDAVAYADRIAHEWNGLARGGMPPYLVGGDYVKMFESDAAETEFQLNVKLATAANVFVLFDERAAAPDWLKRDFEDTGDLIGLDGGPYWKHENKDWSEWESDVGAGASIDRRFRVWRRRTTEATEVRLGANVAVGPNASKPAAMYGVVAVPLPHRGRSQ